MVPRASGQRKPVETGPWVSGTGTEVGSGGPRAGAVAPWLVRRCWKEMRPLRASWTSAPEAQPSRLAPAWSRPQNVHDASCRRHTQREGASSMSARLADTRDHIWVKGRECPPLAPAFALACRPVYLSSAGRTSLHSGNVLSRCLPSSGPCGSPRRSWAAAAGAAACVRTGPPSSHAGRGRTAGPGPTPQAVPSASCRSCGCEVRPAWHVQPRRKFWIDGAQASRAPHLGKETTQPFLLCWGAGLPGF